MKKRDKNIIKNQLNREPNNVLEVVVYCPRGLPAVVLTAPFGDEGKTINPTIFWLTCPFLIKEISRLEDQGYIRELTERLHLDNDFRDKVEQAHRNYADRRMELIPERSLVLAQKISEDILTVLRESGVGGIRDKGGIKCLHTHYADYLARGDNPIGEIVHGLVSWPDETGSDFCENCGD
ncbi:MAG: DUF501 domain-containing protein [Halanaerobiaceae bacterium]